MMDMFWGRLYLLCFIICCSHCTMNQEDFTNDVQAVLIETKPGPMFGRQENFIHGAINATTTSFLGIPYAEPPTGPKRFAPPIRIEGWVNRTHPYRALHERLLCADVDIGSNALYGIEDCLYINIYVPDNLRKRENIFSMRLPVMIYLPPRNPKHGVMPDPRLLAHEGNIIVATVAYRTGVLGYLSHRGHYAGNTPGNVGLMDQRMAMQWIWDNIQEFGGNPGRITLCGDAEGATSVLLHTLIPDGNDVFVRAIVQNAVLEQTAITQHNAHEKTRQLAESLSCAMDDIVYCLQEQSVRTLLTHSHVVESAMGAWLPVTDNNIVPEFSSNQQLIEKLHVTDLLIGFNKFAAFNVQSKSLIQMPNGQYLSTLSEGINYIAEQHRNGEQAERIHRLMSNEYAECYYEDFIIEQKVLTELLTDYFFVAPMINVASSFSRSRNVYVYEFDYLSRFIEDERPDYITAALHDHSPYLFGDSTMDTWPVTEIEFGKAIRNGWILFAKSSNPNSLFPDGGVTWSPFNELQQSYLRFDIPLDSSQERTFPRGRQMAFWNTYLPHVLNSTDCNQYHSYCHAEVQAITQKHQQSSNIVFILAGVIVVLCILCLFLLLSHIVPCKRWKAFCTRRKKKHNLSTLEAERKKLHPLPYCDDN